MRQVMTLEEQEALNSYITTDMDSYEESHNAYKPSLRHDRWQWNTALMMQVRKETLSTFIADDEEVTCNY